jgi:hypothetical protein
MSSSVVKMLIFVREAALSAASLTKINPFKLAYSDNSDYNASKVFLNTYDELKHLSSKGKCAY